MRAEFRLVWIIASKKVIAFGAAANHLFKDVRAQSVTDYFRRVFGMKAFLEKGNGIVVAKAELRAYDFAIQFQQPELKPSAPQECCRHLEVEISPVRICKCARLAAAGPAHLVQVEQRL